MPIPMDNKSGVGVGLLPTHPQPQALPGPCSGVLGGPSAPSLWEQVSVLYEGCPPRTLPPRGRVGLSEAELPGREGAQGAWSGEGLSPSWR